MFKKQKGGIDKGLRTLRMKAHAAAITAAVFHDFFERDGTRILVWQKDDAGKRLGDVKLSLAVAYYLQVADNAFTILKA